MHHKAHSTIHMFSFHILPSPCATLLWVLSPFPPHGEQSPLKRMLNTSVPCWAFNFFPNPRHLFGSWIGDEEALINLLQHSHRKPCVYRAKAFAIVSRWKRGREGKLELLVGDRDGQGRGRPRRQLEACAPADLIRLHGDLVLWICLTSHIFCVPSGQPDTA